MGYSNFTKNDRREVISGGLFEREITWDHEYIVLEKKNSYSPRGIYDFFAKIVWGIEEKSNNDNHSLQS